MSNTHKSWWASRKKELEGRVAELESLESVAKEMLQATPADDKSLILRIIAEMRGKSFGRLREETRRHED